MRSSLGVVLFSLAACKGDAVAPLVDAPSLPDAREFVDAPFLGCTPPTGAGTSHGGSVSAAETWTAADSPHRLPFDTSVYAAVTLEPCAIVQIAGGKTITINPGGSIVAAGTSARVVTFERLDANAWASIRALGGDLSLTHTILSGGGDPLNTLPQYAATIVVQGSGAVGSLHVDGVEIADSASQGVYLDGQIGFDATSQDLVVHGAASFPVHAYARVIGSIPSGTYTGNARDEIAIAGAGGAVIADTTLHARGVPYHVGSGVDGGRLDVSGSNGVALLTIEAGVTMRFPAGGTLNIDATTSDGAAQGALIAIGTPAAKIVFTSDAATAQAGDWLGIGFGRLPDPRDAMQYVQVAYAGGPGTGSNSCPYPGRVGQNDAAIRLFGINGPGSAFITSTEIIASLRDGIDRGWRDDVATDFLAGNTFDVAGCKESVPRDKNGACPATPACP